MGIIVTGNITNGRLIYDNPWSKRGPQMSMLVLRNVNEEFKQAVAPMFKDGDHPMFKPDQVYMVHMWMMNHDLCRAYLNQLFDSHPSGVVTVTLTGRVVLAQYIDGYKVKLEMKLEG